MNSIFSNSELITLNYSSIENQDAIILNEIPEIPTALTTTLKNYYEKAEQLYLFPQ